ncbi:unnamed protein product [Closterium sp. Yama58-4]|nr:unnamed protein product [Closterium sp. Yama58-4]
MFFGARTNRRRSNRGGRSGATNPGATNPSAANSTATNPSDPNSSATNRATPSATPGANPTATPTATPSATPSATGPSVTTGPAPTTTLSTASPSAATAVDPMMNPDPAMDPTASTTPFLSALASLALPPIRITSTRVKLPDGRHVAVCEWGAAASDARVTIVVLHGTPSCRLVGIPMINPSLLLARKIRIVSFDRPGIGQSDYHPGWTLHSSASDLLYLAPLLSLPPKFWVLGYSGGGPHALAAARFLPDRLAGVVLWAGDVNPWDLVAAMVGGGGMRAKRGVAAGEGRGESGGEREQRRGFREWGAAEESKETKESSGSSGSKERSEPSSMLSKLHKQWSACQHAALFALSLWAALPFPARLRFECLRWIPPSVVPLLCPLLFPPSLVRVLAPVVLSETAIHRALMSYVQWADAQAISHPHTLHRLAATCQEALYQGNVQAVLEDLLLPAQPWGFSLTDLKHFDFPIHVWQGTEDQDVPVLLSDLLAHLLPCVSLHLLHGHGHYSPFTHPDFHRFVLDTLSPAAVPAAAVAGDS